MGLDYYVAIATDIFSSQNYFLPVVTVLVP
jgi:hypothetical protein